MFLFFGVVFGTLNTVKILVNRSNTRNYLFFCIFLSSVCFFRFANQKTKMKIVKKKQNHAHTNTNVNNCRIFNTISDSIFDLIETKSKKKKTGICQRINFVRIVVTLRKYKIINNFIFRLLSENRYFSLIFNQKQFG